MDELAALYADINKLNTCPAARILHCVLVWCTPVANVAMVPTVMCEKVDRYPVPSDAMLADDGTRGR